MDTTGEGVDHEKLVLMFFCAVFDGHDGAKAADYCSKGLLPHILAETYAMTKKYVTSSNDADGDTDMKRKILSSSYDESFRRAQRRFGSYCTPPTFEELSDGVAKVRMNKGFWYRLCCTPQRGLRGGTTATTLALYTLCNKERDRFDPYLYAVVANAGDSRCISDDGRGTENFRNVTWDHRPSDPREMRRLKPFVQRGNTYVHRENRWDAVRVHPGGLAVSRTIGDVEHSAGVVPTPDVFYVDLSPTGNQTCSKGMCYRFVIGSDGIFDVLNTAEVGAVARQYGNAEGNKNIPQSRRSAIEACQMLMEVCLAKDDRDDITIIVVDISLA